MISKIDGGGDFLRMDLGIGPSGRVPDPSPDEIQQQCREILRRRDKFEAKRKQAILRRTLRIRRLLERRGPMTIYQMVQLLGIPRRTLAGYLADEIEAGKIVRTDRCNTPIYSLKHALFSADDSFADLPSADSVLATFHARAKRRSVESGDAS